MNDEVTTPDDFRCGFVTLVGRPNVGKSSLVNVICGAKVSIVSDKPQTTRHRVRGVYNEPGAQLVFVDTPGLHKPVTALGERVNATALDALAEHLVARAPEGPPLFPTDTVRDVPPEVWVAELVREQLLAVTRDEL